MAALSLEQGDHMPDGGPRGLDADATAPGPDASAGLRVLLFSPIAGRDPLSGDTSYTQALLDNPPQGVRYTNYNDALADGTLRLRGRKPGKGKAGVENWLIWALRALEIGCRRAGLLFREPTWFVEVDAAAFDLVHVHLFAVRQVRSNVPVVSSAGYPLTELYKAREGWHPLRLYWAERLELLWARALRIHVPWLHHVPPAIMSTYTRASADFLVERGCPRELVRVIGTGLPAERGPDRCSNGHAVLFVGRNFVTKGGPCAIQAYELLRRRGAEITLTVVTDQRTVPPQWLSADVEWQFNLPRQTLLSDVLPRSDILLAPTSADCGAPYAMLEAMRSGLAVVRTELPWLDSRLAGPGVMTTKADPASVADAVQALLEEPMLRQAQAGAQHLFNSTFTIERLGQDLLVAYRECLRLAEAQS